MPELPEMETYKRLLTEKIVGKRIVECEVTREKSINIGVVPFKQQLNGTSITAIERRAKHLIFHLSSGKKMLLHLMLGGWIYFGNETDNPNRTKQISIHFHSGILYFIGLRLGYLHLLEENELNETLKNLGPEPLESAFSEEIFLPLLGKRKGSLKTLLTNQSFIAGIGNFYSDEICFEAGILPMKKANELTDGEKGNLYHAIQHVLRRGIQQGGYMEHPFFQHDTHTGQVHAYIYDKEGQPCSRCAAKIQKGEISGKKTFFCTNCQR